ncbi:MAG: putative membrane protein YkoI [Halieaceae bacterium]
MTLRTLFIPLVWLALCLPAAPLWAIDQSELEAWQERILRTLERQEQKRDDVDKEDSQRGESLAEPRRRDSGASEAATRASKRYGGRVLAVARSGDGYRVRLLLENGRVTTVEIQD